MYDPRSEQQLVPKREVNRPLTFSLFFALQKNLFIVKKSPRPILYTTLSQSFQRPVCPKTFYCGPTNVSVTEAYILQSGIRDVIPEILLKSLKYFTQKWNIKSTVGYSESSFHASLEMFMCCRLYPLLSTSEEYNGNMSYHFYLKFYFSDDLRGASFR